MINLERKFLKSENIKSWIWLKYIDDIFFIWLKSEKEVDGFLGHLNKFDPSVTFTYEKLTKK